MLGSPLDDRLKKPEEMVLFVDVPEREAELLWRWWCVVVVAAWGEEERRREKSPDFWVGTGAGGGEGSRRDPKSGIFGNVISLELSLDFLYSDLK